MVPQQQIEMAEIVPQQQQSIIRTTPIMIPQQQQQQIQMVPHAGSRYLIQTTSNTNANTNTGVRRYSITYFHEQPKLGQKLEKNLFTNEVFVKSINPSMANFVAPYGLKPGDVMETLTASAEGINNFAVTQLNDSTMAILKKRPITITYRSSGNTGMMHIQGQNHAGVLQNQPMEQQGQSNNITMSEEIQTVQSEGQNNAGVLQNQPVEQHFALLKNQFQL